MTDDIKVEIDGDVAIENLTPPPDSAHVVEDMKSDSTQVKLEVEPETEDISLPADFDGMTAEEIIAAREQYNELYFKFPPNFPDEEKLEAWKQRYGKIRTRRMGFEEAYIVRPMNRSEFRGYLKMVEQHEGDEIEARMYQEELMVEMCMVWPPVTVRDIRGETDPTAPIAAAGTASMLSADIQEISNMEPTAVGPFEEL